MSEIGSIFFVTLAWGLANAGAAIAAGLRIAKVPGPQYQRVLLGIVFFIVLLVGNIVGFFLSFAFGYCENCSGKPVSASRVLTGLIVALPSGVIWFLVVFVKFHDQQAGGAEVPPKNVKSKALEVDEYIPTGPLGVCPNCSSHLPVDSRSCLRCKAIFGDGAAWKISPLNLFRQNGGSK